MLSGEARKETQAPLVPLLPALGPSHGPVSSLLPPYLWLITSRRETGCMANVYGHPPTSCCSLSTELG